MLTEVNFAVRTDVSPARGICHGEGIPPAEVYRVRARVDPIAGVHTHLTENSAADCDRRSERRKFPESFRTCHVGYRTANAPRNRADESQRKAKCGDHTQGEATQSHDIGVRRYADPKCNDRKHEGEKGKRSASCEEADQKYGSNEGHYKTEEEQDALCI